MKKLIAVLTLCFAFTISANAQDKKQTNEQRSSDLIAALNSKIPLGESLKKDMYTLMVMKQESLSNPSLTAVQREEISKAYEHKIMSGLTEQQRTILASDPQLLKKLTH